MENHLNLNQIVLAETPEIYVVKHKGKIVDLDGKQTFSRVGYAKSRLKKVLTANYNQGHYWHKGKKNTFAAEGGHFRNGGKMAGLDKIFKEFGSKLADELLDNSMFTIEKIQ